MWSIDFAQKQESVVWRAVAFKECPQLLRLIKHPSHCTLPEVYGSSIVSGHNNWGGYMALC
jgi:hypothetical protein